MYLQRKYYKIEQRNKGGWGSGTLYRGKSVIGMYLSATLSGMRRTEIPVGKQYMPGMRGEASDGKGAGMLLLRSGIDGRYKRILWAM